MRERRSDKDCVLITADLHLTDRKIDAYRWDIFPWIINQIRNRGTIKEVFILGDLTHQKNNHSAGLVLRLIGELQKVAELAPVRILKGNHDYVDSSQAFFSFIDSFPNIKYYSKPTKSKVLGKKAYFFPHTGGLDYNGKKKLRSLKGRFEYVFVHQCFEGANAANNHHLNGTPLKSFRELGTCLIAGDIHKPQTMGNLTYVGSPYPVAFGDDFDPRVLLLSRKGLKSVPRTAPLKSAFEVASIEELKALELAEGDQIRIIYKTGRIDGEAWSEFKNAAAEYCERLGGNLRSLQVASEEVLAEDSKVSSVGNDPRQVIEAYCKENKIADSEQNIGLELLEI